MFIRLETAGCWLLIDGCFILEVDVSEDAEEDEIFLWCIGEQFPESEQESLGMLFLPSYLVSANVIMTDALSAAFRLDTLRLSESVLSSALESQ